MSKFIPVTIIEKADGLPGIVEPEEFNILINVNEITMINRGEEEGMCFIRTSCGASLCVITPFGEFIDMLRKLNIELPPDKSIPSTIRPVKKIKKKVKK